MADIGDAIIFDAKDKILGRLASLVAKTCLEVARSGEEKSVIIVNAEHVVISGSRVRVTANYQAKYRLNHPRKGPFFPRMPDRILKRTVRGMLPYQKNPTGRKALRTLKVLIGNEYDFENLPEGVVAGDASTLDKPLPEQFVRLGEISKTLGAPSKNWDGGEN